MPKFDVLEAKLNQNQFSALRENKRFVQNVVFGKPADSAS